VDQVDQVGLESLEDQMDLEDLHHQLAQEQVAEVVTALRDR
jgi:hypothetical protein